MNRVIDCLVNVDLGDMKQPEYMHRVKEDYFKGGDSFLSSPELPELLENMDAHNVERAILLSKLRVADDRGRRYAEERPDKFALGVGGLNLLRPVKALRELEAFVKDNPVAYVAVGPSFWGDGMYPPTDPVYYPLYAKCAELDLPLCMNTGIPGPPVPADVQNPIHLDRVCIRFPELKLCMIHGADPWWDTAIRLMLKYRNLRLMTSAWSPKRLPESLLHYLRTRGTNRIIFASDFPALSIERTTTEAADLDLTDEVRDAYLYGNGTSFFFDRLDGAGDALVTLQHPSGYAETAPDRLAVIVEPSHDTLTYRELDERSNQVANLLRARGLRQGDRVAVLLENRREVFEVSWGAMRTGLLVTPINWHLAPDEVAYIVEDCEAAALVASADLGNALERLGRGAIGPAVRLAVGGPVDGFEDYETALAEQPTTPVDDQSEGTWMLYSSGTTGKPKGIKPGAVGGEIGAPTSFGMLVTGLYGFAEGSVYLSPAPLYHAAPAGWTNAVQRLGGTAVVMDRFDPLRTLELIEEHRVTHVQFVPTHLVRMLKLSDEERSRYDLSSLQCVVHAAAPCPPEVKRAVLEWLGPIVHEYYSGSEGAGFCAIGPEEWLAHPGSVGKSMLGTADITDADGTEVAPGEVGQVWFESPHAFSYHGDAAKTSSADDERGWATLGDMGYLDDEGYLYLTDRVTNMIISGGVNIYPREVEDVIILHPRVVDVAVVGVADPDMGEAVRAVVQLADGETPTDELEGELIAFARERLSSFKCPRSVVVVDELPRLATGKLAKRLLPDSALAP